MPKFLAPIDLTNNALNNVTIQNIVGSTGPAGAQKGNLYYDSSIDRLRVNVGTSGSPVWTALSTAADTGNAFSIVTGGNGGTATADAVGDSLALTSANTILSIVASSGANAGVTFTVNQANIDHNSLSNLTSGDPHTQYALLAGRTGGQMIYGGTAASNSLTLRSTSNVTKGTIVLGDSAGKNAIFDETTNIFKVIDIAASGTPNVAMAGGTNGFNDSQYGNISLWVDNGNTAKPFAVTTSGAVISTSTVTATRFISNVAIGTAPLTVTSTTKVTNLNADLLDDLNSATTRPGNSSVIVATVAADGKIDTSFMTGKLAASDLTNGTTGSGAVVLATSPTIVTPTIASFVNATHDHSNAAGGGTIAHSVLTGLTTGDPHTQYALIAGRSGGQTLTGGTGATDNLTLVGTSSGSPTSGGAILFAANKFQTFTTALPTTVNATIEIATFTPTNATAYAEIMLTTSSGSFPISKYYAIPIIAGATAGSFTTVVPLYETGASGTNDFNLEISVANTTAATTFRLRRTASGTTAGNVICALRVTGTASDAITASSTTSTSAVSTYYTYSGMSQSAGAVSFYGDNINLGVGSATTGGGTLNMAGGSITNANNITATGTITAASFSGAFSGSFAVGAQNAPSITFTGRTDVGLYSPAANQVAIVSNNTTKLLVTSTNVGFFGSSGTTQGGSADIRTQLLNLGLMSSATSLAFAAGGSVTTDTVSAVSAGTGSALSINGGASSTASTTGGAVNITGGAGGGTTATGGAVTIKGGTGTSTGGAVIIQNSAGTARFTANTTGISFFGATPIAQKANTDEIAQALTDYGLFSAKPTTLSISGTATAGSVTVSSGGTLTLTDGVGVSIGTSTGTVFGSASAKLAFFGATAIAQQAQTVDLRTLLINLGFYSGTGGATPLNLNGGAFSAGTGSFSGAVNMNSQKITNLLDPTNAQDAATKAYVDATATGLDFKNSVRAASTANVTVTYSATGGTSTRGQITAAPNTLDGVTLAANNRILLKDQSTGAQNGVWVVTTVGTGANGVWDRAGDFDSDAEVTAGAFVFVEEGTANGNNGYVLTTDNPITIGGSSGTALTWTQFSGAGTYTAGSGLTLTGTSFSVNTNTTLGTTITSGNVVLTGQALALHQLATNGIIARTGSGTVAGRTITGTTNRLSVTNGDGVAGNPTVDIDTNYVGQTSITTVGTIGTGTWQGTAVGTSYGGTGATSVAGAKTNLGFMTRYATTITGDGTTSTFSITHNLGTQDVEILVQDPANNYETVYPNSRVTSTTAASIVFGFAPANGVTYRIVVVG